MQNELPEWCPQWAWDEAYRLASQVVAERGSRMETFQPIVAHALVDAERRGVGRASPLAIQLETAVARAEDGAGTLPARQAVKLRPADWHRVTALSRELAAAIRQIGGKG